MVVVVGASVVVVVGGSVVVVVVCSVVVVVVVGDEVVVFSIDHGGPSVGGGVVVVCRTVEEVVEEVVEDVVEEFVEEFVERRLELVVDPGTSKVAGVAALARGADPSGVTTEPRTVGELDAVMSPARSS